MPIQPTGTVTLRGIGTGLLNYDLVRIVSSQSVGALKKILPVTQLQMLSHSFSVTRYKGKDPGLKSNIKIVAPQHLAWCLLDQHHAILKKHRVTVAEVANDIPASAIEDAEQTMRTIISRLDKPRHQRGYLRSQHDPFKKPRPGHRSELPTIYYENRKASVALKCYARYIKLPARQLGGLCVRLEWTLKGKRALRRHLGGNQISHLMAANLRRFVLRNVRLVRIDRVALGELFMLPWQPASGYHARRAANMHLRLHARRQRSKFADEDQASFICEYSPAQIHGYCVELRNKDRSKRRGRRRRAITDYRIKRCFPP